MRAGRVLLGSAVAVVTLAVGAGGVVAPSGATYGGRAGALLLGPGHVGGLDGTVQALPFDDIGPTSTFAPDGGLLATARTNASGAVEIVVRTPGGGARTLATLADGRRVTELSWSPDGSELAANLDHGNGTAGRASDTSIRVYDTSTGDSRQVVLDQSGRPLEGVDWQPKGVLLAYTRNGVDVFTVPATGGTPQNRTGQCTFPNRVDFADCGPLQSGESSYVYDNLDWSPSGDRFALDVVETGPLAADFAEQRYVGLLRLGQTEPTLLAQPGALGGGYVQGRPVWSPDGGRIALTQVRGGEAAVRVIDLLGADVVDFPGRGVVHDWQACPDQGCADWVPVARSDSALRERLLRTTWPRTARPQVRAILTVDPYRLATGRLKLRVDGVAVRRATLTEDMANRAVLRLPRLAPGRHRVQTVYRGSSAVEPSRSAVARVRVTR